MKGLVQWQKAIKVSELVKEGNNFFLGEKPVTLFLCKSFAFWTSDKNLEILDREVT